MPYKENVLRGTKCLALVKFLERTGIRSSASPRLATKKVSPRGDRLQDDVLQSIGTISAVGKSRDQNRGGSRDRKMRVRGVSYFHRNAPVNARQLADEVPFLRETKR